MNTTNIQLFVDRTKFIPAEETFMLPTRQNSKWKMWMSDINKFNWLAILLILCVGLIIYQRYQNKKKYLAKQQNEYIFTGHL